jgi:uncharacterized protein YhaN
MRITGLHLLAYGHFTGYSLDFRRGPDLFSDAAPNPPPGLHVVYGHNEAGKSTTLRALSSVLFGYPHQVVDGFRHDPKDIAIGIDLVAGDGRTLSFERRRRGKRTLTAPDGSALDEETVQNFLGGVSRDVFEKVFALDHHRLRAHAQALLADGGSLGFSLAEAGSGIAGLKAVLDKLKAERAGLFLAAGTKPKLNQAIADLVRLRKEARQFTVSPADYRSHEKQIHETEAELHAMRERRKDIESGMVRLQRIAKNLPLRAEHGALTQRIEALDGVPALPPEFAQQRIKASADLDAARADLAIASAAIEDLERRIAAIAIDDDILARSGDIEALGQKRPVVEKHETDIPRREAERDALLVRVEDLMARAELAGGPADLAGQLPSTGKRKAIQNLADAGKRLMAQRAALQDSAETAARFLTKAQSVVALTPKPRPVGDLARTLTAADKLGDITDDIARRTRALERKTKVLNETVAGLGLPVGAGTPGVPPGEAAGTDRVRMLRQLALPPEKADARYADWFAGLDSQIKDAHDALARLTAELAENAGRIVAVKTAGDIATEDDLKAARRARDAGWALVRGLYVDRHDGLEDAARRFAPDGRIAETYDAHVREADRVVDTLRVRVKESTELALLRRQAASLETKKADVTEQLKVLVEQREAVLAEWRALWPAGLITVQSPGEMIEWLARRSAALATAEELEEERDAVRELVARERAAREALAAAVTGFTAQPPADGLDALRDQARSIIAEAADAKSRHDKAETAVRGLSEQKIQADEATNKVEVRINAWAADWRKALAEAGVPPDQTVEAASATLELISELDGVTSKIDGLNHRIDTMRADRDAFADALARIAAGLADAPAGAAVEVCRLLEERLRAAHNARMERRGLAEQLQSRAADRDRASDRVHRSGAALEALCVQAGVAGPDELAAIERQSAEKRDALREREKIERRAREDGGGRDFTALFYECDDVPGDRIAADLVSLKADRDDLEARIDKLGAEIGALQAEFNALLRENQAADLTQAAAAVSAEIEDSVETYVDLTVQETLLRAAIDVYRDRNQGPILTRARDLFAQLTDGAYRGLRADVEGGETILIVEDAARGSLELDALSDGTVDAVYLALRLAVVQEHNASHEPLPFIADDLLLNLDNRRSEAALRTLADVAKSSQVLLFTHHAHVMELARRAAPPDILVEHSLSLHAGPAERRRAIGG